MSIKHNFQQISASPLLALRMAWRQHDLISLGEDILSGIDIIKCPDPALRIDYRKPGDAFHYRLISASEWCSIKEKIAAVILACTSHI